jgi:hypothetical protein
MRAALLGFAGLVAVIGAGIGMYAALGGGDQEEVVQDVPTPSSDPTQTDAATPTESSAPTITPTARPSLTPIAVPAYWETYTDPILAFSFPHPPGLVVEEGTFELGKVGTCPTTPLRTSVLKTPKGVVSIGLAVAQNLCDLSLEEWVRTYPGWPCDGSSQCEPTSISVGGELALMFPIDQQGEAFPQVYVERAGYIYTIQLNIYGVQGMPATLKESDRDVIIGGFKFAN